MIDDFDLIIEPGKGFKNSWRDVFAYRGLFFFLVWRDILVRYKQTVLGIFWSVLRPILTMVVFTIVFGKLANLPTDGHVPYPVLIFAALLPWQLFANSLSDCSNSIITNSGMISKIYFPRIIIPTSSVLVSFVDFFISMFVLGAVMVWFGVYPGWQILLLPLFLLQTFFLSLGLGLWTSALTVKYRDFRFIVPFFLQLGLFVSPVGFSSNIVPSSWRLLYSVNPMVGIIDGFRWALYGGSQLYLPGLFFSFLITFVIFMFGLAFFGKSEEMFSDVI